ncbi:unnamed protein product, partial [Nesidiocoris tenuis]
MTKRWATKGQAESIGHQAAASDRHKCVHHFICTHTMANRHSYEALHSVLVSTAYRLADVERQVAHIFQDCIAPSDGSGDGQREYELLGRLKKLRDDISAMRQDLSNARKECSKESEEVTKPFVRKLDSCETLPVLQRNRIIPTGMNEGAIWRALWETNALMVRLINDVRFSWELLRPEKPTIWHELILKLKLKLKPKLKLSLKLEVKLTLIVKPKLNGRKNGSERNRKEMGKTAICHSPGRHSPACSGWSIGQYWNIFDDMGPLSNNIGRCQTKSNNIGQYRTSWTILDRSGQRAMNWTQDWTGAQTQCDAGLERPKCK